MYAHAHAPCRIGIAGGGTDLPAWTRKRPGLCLSLAIDTYAHAVAITRRDGQVVASYRQRDVASCATEIANGLIRESALIHGWEDGFEVHTLSEVSSLGSGLGVSSSIAVALAAAFARMSLIRNGVTVEPKWLDGGEPIFQQDVAKAAWTVEIDRLHRPIGRQDHMAATHGGLRIYRFEGDAATIEKTFSEGDAQWVASHLALVTLPDGHDSRAILSRVSRTQQLQDSYDAVPVALRAIETHDARALGAAVDMCHSSKDTIPGAVTEAIRYARKTLLTESHGFGCKVAGAGGGGHLVVVHDGSDDAIERIGRSCGLPARAVRPDLRGVQSETQP